MLFVKKMLIDFVWWYSEIFWFSLDMQNMTVINPCSAETEHG